MKAYRPGQTFYAYLRDADTGLVGTLGVRIENSDGSTYTARTTAGIVEIEPGSGVYSVPMTAPTEQAQYVILWDTGGVTPEYAAEDILVTGWTQPDVGGPPGDVYDLRDTRVLIPRTRRALEGPDSVSGSAAVAAGLLSDDEVNATIADAIADVIFYSGGLFGHTLEVVARDTDYLAPIAWLVDPVMSEAEATVIVAQAALNYFFAWAKTIKTSQRIADEGQEWEYSLSAQLLTEQIKALRDARDRALEQLSLDEGANDAWISTIQMRDAQTSAMIEPWVLGGVGGQQVDARFGTWF